MGLEIDGFGVGFDVGFLVGREVGLKDGRKDGRAVGVDVSFMGLDVGPLDTQKLVFQDLLQHSS